MINRLRLFFTSQKQFFWLSAFFIAYLGAYFLHYLTNNAITSFLMLAGGLFFMFFGTGIFFVLVLQWLIKRKFEVWEFISLSLISGIIIFTSILEIEFFIKGKIYDWYPVANSITFWIISGIFIFLQKTSLPKFNFSLKLIIKHPLFLVFALGLFFTTFQVLLYPSLPDLDPYKWLYKYTYQFANHLLDYEERPLFGSLIFIGTRFTGISILNFFKYILPFFFILALFPAWMVAQSFDDRKKQWLWLLFSFTSPVIILYSEIAMPQTIFIVLSYFILFFLLYSYKKQNDFFLYIAGISAFLSFFFHQAGSIIFTIWLFIIIITKHRSIFNNKKSLFFILLLILSNFKYFNGVYKFILSWTMIVYARFYSPDRLNLLYPGRYTNIDSNSMGWNSFDGIIKFYAYHAGPLVIALILIFILLLISNSNFRKFIIGSIKFRPALLTITGAFLVFFSIAEILPRFPNIALLPDRAWIFAGIFSFTLLFFIFEFYKKIPGWSVILFILLLITDLSGAFYINYTKKYLMTPAQVRSAEWIKNKLPKNRIFLSYGHKHLLPVYADSIFAGIISSSLYCSDNINDFQTVINSMNDSLSNQTTLNNSLETFLDNSKNIIDNLKNKDNDALKSEDINLAINTLINKATQFKNTINAKTEITVFPPLSVPIEINKPIRMETSNKQKKITFNDLMESPLYIYYARENPLNPYYSRPYEMMNWGIEPCLNGKFLFDQYPEKFKRVYYTKDEEIIIWKVL